MTRPSKRSSSHLHHRDSKIPVPRQRFVWASILGLAVGTIAFLFAWFTQGFLYFGNLSDDMRDISLAIRANDRAVENLRVPLVFLAIDDATHDGLGRPTVTPRDRLATLLEELAAQKPRMIVLDIDIAEPASEAQQSAFMAALKKLAKSGTKLLIVRAPSRIYTRDGPAQFAQTPYDAIVDSTPSFSWVSAQGLRGPTGVARRMLSWVPGCQGSKPRYFLNATFAASELIVEPVNNSSHAWHSIFPKPDWVCPTRQSQTSSSLVSIRLKQPRGDLAVHHEELIDYSISWQGSESGSKQRLSIAGHETNQLVTVVPAAPLLLDPEFSRTGSLLHDSIVVVGVSYSGAPDYVETPLGRMPGAFMLINHIRGVLDFGIEPPASFWENLFLSLLIALITANLMIWVGEKWGPWLEMPLPFVLSGLWAIALIFTVGSNMYFGLSLSPLLVGLLVLVLPRKLKVNEAISAKSRQRRKRT